MSPSSRQTHPAPASATSPLDRALFGLAAGRLALAAGSLLAPRGMARAFGVAPSPELTYMTRIFGGHALALGAGYLLSEPGPGRRLWQRLALIVDVSDTASGLAHVARRDLGRGNAVALTALTGTYAVLGATRAITDG